MPERAEQRRAAAVGKVSGLFWRERLRRVPSAVRELEGGDGSGEIAAADP